MAGTISVPDFPAVTTLEITDILYLIRGTGTDRDKTVTQALLQNYIGDNVSQQDTTGSINLNDYYSNLVISSDPVADITLTFSGALPAGKKLAILNTSDYVITALIEGNTHYVNKYNIQEFFSNGTDMFIMKNVKESITINEDDFTILDGINDLEINVITGASNRTVTLPTVADNSGRKITIMKTDSGTGKVIIDGEGSEEIKGQGWSGYLTLDLYKKNDLWEGKSNGTSWITQKDEFEKPRCYVSLSADQSIPHSTATLIAFDTVDEDSHSWYTNTAGNYKYTPLIKGLYLAQVSGNMDSCSMLACQIRKNGTAISANRDGSSTDAYRSVQTMKVIEFDGSTDYIQGYVVQSDSTSGANDFISGHNAYMQINFIRRT